MRIRLLALGAALTVAGCATASKYTIENRLMDLGLDRNRASCMADELDNRLSNSELAEFAEFTTNLARRDNPLELLRSLTSISDPDIAKAATQSGLACIIPR